MQVAGPRSAGCSQALRAQTTCLAGVTSITWMVPGQSFGFFNGPGHQ